MKKNKFFLQILLVLSLVTITDSMAQSGPTRLCQKSGLCDTFTHATRRIDPPVTPILRHGGNTTNGTSASNNLWSNNVQVGPTPASLAAEKAAKESRDVAKQQAQLQLQRQQEFTHQQAQPQKQQSIEQRNQTLLDRQRRLDNAQIKMDNFPNTKTIQSLSPNQTANTEKMLAGVDMLPPGSTKDRILSNAKNAELQVGSTNEFLRKQQSNKVHAEKVRRNTEHFVQENRQKIINNQKSIKKDYHSNVINREPKSLQDQMTLEAAKKDEGFVKIIAKDLKDPTLKNKADKMELEIISKEGKRSNVHYVKNLETGKLGDFKFKKSSTDKIKQSKKN